jgi:hypothetical protein
MKKLAMALVCLVSVAFFASCNPDVQNPEPSIAVMTGENFVYDNQTVDLGVTYSIGFRAASNAQTKKELSKFNLNASLYEADGNLIYTKDTTITVSGTEYVFQNNNLVFENTVRELVGKAVFTASITDVAGKVKSTTINLSINRPAQPLVVNDFSWNRHGAAAVTGGIEEVGLSWTSNGKEDFAILKPVEGATLYGFDPEEWGKTTTDVQKAALFTEGVHSVMSEFRGVSAWSSKDYNFVIGTVYNGKFNLIHITKGEVSTFKGTDVTIIGQIK